jgi:hypothetical protein
MYMRALTEKDVTFKILCEPEEASIKGNASAIDPKTDRETEDFIQKELDSGNEWAWCTVTVVACWKNHRGYDSLGCCCYKSEKDFKKDAYCSDMKARALENLNANIAETLNELAELVD